MGRAVEHDSAVLASAPTQAAATSVARKVESAMAVPSAANSLQISLILGNWARRRKASARRITAAKRLVLFWRLTRVKNGAPDRMKVRTGS